MKRKPKPLATRNPFVVLAMKRKAGSHRKPNKAIRRAEKVNLYGDVAQCKSIWLWVRLFSAMKKSLKNNVNLLI